MRTPRPKTFAAAALAMTLAAGSWVGSEEIRAGERPVPTAAVAGLRRSLAAALAAVPQPSSPYRLDRTSSVTRVNPAAGWDAAADRWAAPAEGSAERVYVAGGDEDQEDGRTVEIRVFLNLEPSLPTGLASVAGEPRLVALSTAPAVEVTTIGAEEGQRVALPVTPEEAAEAVTIIRLYVGGPAVEQALRRLLAEETGESTNKPTHTMVPTRRADHVQAVIVELYGPKAEVERLARGVKVGALRKLLRN